MSNLSLNEAIRIGCQLRGECRDVFINEDGDCCAIGAAYVGSIDRNATLSDTFMYTNWKNSLVSLFPELDKPVTLICKCSHDGGTRKMINIISHLHLTHKWSREAIAEWADPHPELHIPMPKMEGAPKEHKVHV